MHATDIEGTVPMNEAPAVERPWRLYYPLLVLLAVILVASPAVAPLDNEELNFYVQQADAFLHGRLHVGHYTRDLAVYQGRYYVPFPPIPALVLLPLVAAFGLGVNVRLAALAVMGLSVALLARILKRLEIEPPSALWLVAAFFLGTAYWFVALAGSTGWFFAHIVAVACMFLAIYEALGRGRGLLVGLFLGLAFLSRQMSIYSGLFLCAALWGNPDHSTRRRKLAHLLGFLLSLGLCAGLYLAFNWARFGSPFDTGYSYIVLGGFLKERVGRFGLFNLAYVPANLIHLFLQGFHVEFSPPSYLGAPRMDPFGTSLTFASPFVFVALWARWRRGLLWTAWLGIGLSVVHALLYYNNGWWQQNAHRFTLDFLPLLMVLVALGTRRLSPRAWKPAVLYSILLNLLALFLVPLLWRATP